MHSLKCKGTEKYYSRMQKLLFYMGLENNELHSLCKFEYSDGMGMAGSFLGDLWPHHVTFLSEFCRFSRSR